MSNDDHHDAASTAARLAGLGESTHYEPVTPEQLVQRFCLAVPAGLAASHGWRPHPKHARARFARGHCGYIGGRGALMQTGFDDGYTFMGHLEQRGWRAMAAKGNWPYDIWLRWPARDEHPETLAQYLEADLTVCQFEDHDAARAFYTTLPAAP